MLMLNPDIVGCIKHWWKNLENGTGVMDKHSYTLLCRKLQFLLGEVGGAGVQA